MLDLRRRVSEGAGNLAKESMLPPALLVLGEALRPIARKMEKRMRQAPSRRERQRGDVLEFISRRLQWICDDIEALADAFGVELDGTLAGDANDAEVRRAVSRTEMAIDQLLDGYDDVRRAHGDSRDARGLSLLEDVYLDTLEPILAWLKDILELVDEPSDTWRRRGLPTKGDVERTLGLDLKPSLHLTPLLRWAQRRAEETAHRHSNVHDDRLDQEAARNYRRGEYGMMALVLSAFGLGWLFGDDEYDE